jgi:hypothetical protein
VLCTEPTSPLNGSKFYLLVKQAGLEEEEKLKVENENLKKEIESVRRDLILAEIGNGGNLLFLNLKYLFSSTPTWIFLESLDSLFSGSCFFGMIIF